MYMEEQQACEDNNSVRSEAYACIKEADQRYHENASSIYLKTRRDIVETWAFYITVGLFWAFVTALVVRTVGYIALGFARTQPGPPEPSDDTVT